jgi:hypothetical protein
LAEERLVTSGGAPLWRKILREIGRARDRYFGPPHKPQVSSSAAARAEARVAAAAKAYRASPIAQEKDSFILVRIIGNDLEPRHRTGQSFDNLSFILDHEPDFPECEKFWIVNRIVDPGEEARILKLLDGKAQHYRRLPFDSVAYRRAGWDLSRVTTEDARFSRRFQEQDARRKLRYDTAIRRLKNLYLMNNNGARNLALDIGRERAKWVMPWDGNCFLTRAGFAEIRGIVTTNAHLPVTIVPMCRVVENDVLLKDEFRPDANEEPQIIFRADCGERFNEEFAYGRRPKVELLWRLGVRGDWDRYRQDRWDVPRRPASPDAGLFNRAGWVARLASGRSELEVGNPAARARGVSRDEAIIRRLDRSDADAIAAILDPAALAYYDESALRQAAAEPSGALAAHLKSAAEAALKRGPYSVLDKSDTAPSGDKQDYFHPAPYWWPDPNRPDGLPFVPRDGVRVPGTVIYNPESDRYDRTRLQRVFDDTTVLALAATVLGEERFAEHGARLVRTWFIDPATRMNPHLRYAQVRAGHLGNQGAGRGIIEFKDVYFFLDAVRLLERHGALNIRDRSAIRLWLTEYSGWLVNSPAARQQFVSENNHGIFFDVQKAAIAAFLGDAAALAAHTLHARERVIGQIAPDGSLPYELARTRPLHYTLFTLQGFTTVARILSSFGDDLWSFRAGSGQGLETALRWIADHFDDPQFSAERETIGRERLQPLLLDLARLAPGTPAPDAALTPVFHPDDAVAPYWPLRRQ